MTRGVKAIHVGYYVALAARLGTVAFAMWLSPLVSMAITLAVALLALGLGVMALLLPPAGTRRARIRSAVVVTAALIVSVALSRPAQRAGQWLYWRSRAPALSRLTADVLRDGRVHAMSDGRQAYKSLNGTTVTFEPGEPIDTLWAARSAVYPLTQVLARDGIERAQYEDYRRRLVQLRMSELVVTSGYVGFLHGGFLDNLEGFLWVRPGHAPPPPQSELFLTQLTTLHYLGDGWYYFGTT